MSVFALDPTPFLNAKHYALQLRCSVEAIRFTQLLKSCLDQLQRVAVCMLCKRGPVILESAAMCRGVDECYARIGFGMIVATLRP